MKERTLTSILMSVTVMMLAIIMALSAPAAIAAETREGCTLQQMAAKRPKEGIYEKNGHIYVYKKGKLQTGYFKYKGACYYGHKQKSKEYPKGAVTRWQCRIRSGKWYYYGHDGKMCTESVYAIAGHRKKVLVYEISKDGRVKYIYNNSSKVRGSIRYNTKKRRLEKEETFGEWHPIDGELPDGFVDTQK